MNINRRCGANISAAAVLESDKVVFTANEKSDHARFFVEFSIKIQPEDSYVFMPSCAYDGNRFESVSRKYPPFYLESEFGLQRETLISDIPRLEKNGNSVMEVTVGDLAVPCIGVLNKKSHKCWFIFFHQQVKEKNLGIKLFESNGVLTIRLDGPADRKHWYTWKDDVPGIYPVDSSMDLPISVEKGEIITISFHEHLLPCADIEQFFEIFYAIRCERLVESDYNVIPFSKVFEILENKKNAYNIDAKEHFYTVAITEEPYLSSRYGRWTPGWTGGGTISYPFLCFGNALSKKYALSTLDFVPTVQSEFGLFYGIKAHDGIHHDCGGRYEEKYSAVFMRKHADLSYFLFKQLEEMRTLGYEISEKLECCAKKSVDAIVKIFHKYHDLGQFVNGETGDMLVGQTTAGGVAIGALALASRWFEDPSYMDVAEKLAALYYNRNVKSGIINGGQVDMLGSPDSEAAAGTLEGYVTLYECTGKEVWKKAAIAVAHQLASWIVSYDYIFPKRSEFARLGVKSSGSVIANLQNKHSAPGLATYSAAGYFKLYRMTKDERYLHEMRRITRFIPQVMPFPGHDVYSCEQKAMRLGFINERVNLSDWEGTNMVGEIYDASNWPEVCPLMSQVETPGIYIDKSENTVFVIDFVSAELKDNSLIIHNTSEYDCYVTVMAETDEDRQKPLGGFWANRFTKVPVAAGMSAEISI